MLLLPSHIYGTLSDLHAYHSFMYSYTHSKYLPRAEDAKRKEIYEVFIPKLLTAYWVR